MNDLPDCFYCRKDQRLHDLMIEIAPLSASTPLPLQGTDAPGRSLRRRLPRARETSSSELSDEERNAFMKDVGRRRPRDQDRLWREEDQLRRLLRQVAAPAHAPRAEIRRWRELGHDVRDDARE